MPNGIDLILADHAAVRELFAEFDKSREAGLIGQIIDALKAHDDAEHAALYPMAWSLLDDGKLSQRCEIAHSRVKQQIELITGLEGQPLIDGVRVLRDLVLEHATDEEKNVLPALASRATEQQLGVLGARILQAKQRGG
jgi:hemerythrin superfamily protein